METLPTITGPIATHHASDLDVAMPHLVKGVAILALPAVLPVVLLWHLWTQINRLAQFYLCSAADISPKPHYSGSIDDYVLKGSQLYSGLNLAGQNDVLNQGAMGKISTLVYLYRPKSMERPIGDLMQRPMILGEFLMRVSHLSRVALFKLGAALKANPLSCLLFAVLGLSQCSLFTLSSGLSPEPTVPE